MNGTLIEYQARASMLQPAPMDILEPENQDSRRPHPNSTSATDDPLTDSLPASDPLACTTAIVRPAPSAGRTRRGAHRALLAARDLIRRAAALL
jgi:hypothetical protein